MHGMLQRLEALLQPGGGGLRDAAAAVADQSGSVSAPELPVTLLPGLVNPDTDLRQ